jgi:Rad3-related DNA helicase
MVSRRIRWICDQHQERILIHSVSYSLSEVISQGIDKQRQVFRYDNAESRQATFDGWQESESGVLVGPSMGIGVDLPDDRCRVQVIAKVPWGNLGDRQISERLYSPGGRLWYATECVRDIVQMCGRIVRSKDDWGVTYILDKEFLRMWRDYQGLFPSWWKEGVRF